jgi:hypothetical protein
MIAILEGEEWDKKKFEEIKVKNFLQLVTDTKLQIQKAQAD